MEPELPQSPSSASKPNSISYLALVSGIIWIFAALPFIYWLQDSTLAKIVASEVDILFQIAVGFLSGTLFGAFGYVFAGHPGIKKISDEYYIIRQIKELNLSNKQIFLVSLSAGISEEIFFRGAIQPLIGIWFTSALFIGVHGYIRFQSPAHFLFALFTFVLSMVLGWLFIYYGLIAAITAHAVYDIIVLYKISKRS